MVDRRCEGNESVERGCTSLEMQTLRVTGSIRSGLYGSNAIVVPLHSPSIQSNQPNSRLFRNNDRLHVRDPIVYFSGAITIVRPQAPLV